MSKSSAPMPVPRAVIRVPISAELNILSKRAGSTFRILPRGGRMAWGGPVGGWVGGVAALLAGAPGRIALDDEEFAERGIAFLAVGELARQRADIERALAA